MQIPDGRPPLVPGWPVACVEIGGGGVQTILFEDDHTTLLDGAVQPDGFELAIAVPGVVEDGIVNASNLGWTDTDPVVALGLDGPARIVLNDAEAAALGEAVLRGERGLASLVYMCAGTGIGGAVVRDGAVERANIFGHNVDGYGTSFGDLPCPCGRRGCLETIAAGWALPDPLDEATVRETADHLAAAIDRHELASSGVVVIGGGIAQRYPALTARIEARLGGREVERTAAPLSAKSAAAWGLRYALTAAASSIPGTSGARR